MSLNLKIKRIEKGYKQYELAGAAGVSRHYLYKLENGRAKNPSMQVMKKLALALDSDIMELFFN